MLRHLRPNSRMLRRRRFATPHQRRLIRRRISAYTPVMRRMDELTDYMQAMDSYIRDGSTVLRIFRQSAPYYDADTEEHMLKWLDQAVDSARAFQNSMSGLVSLANNLRRYSE